MRKLTALAFALSAVFAMSALAATTAFAEELPAEYLFNGEPIAEGAELPVDTTGEILFEVMNPPLGNPLDLLCSGLFGGTIMGPKDGLITEVVDLAGSANIICTFTEKGFCSGTTALLEMFDLPWLTEPLLEGANFVIDIVETAEGGGKPGFKAVCDTIIGELTYECAGNTGALATNVAEGIDGVFQEGNEEITPAIGCTLGGEKSGLFGGAGGVTVDTSGPGLSISS